MLWTRLQRIWWWRKPRQHHHVDFSFDSSELTLSIDDFARRYLDPAIEILTARIEALEHRPPPWYKRASSWLGLRWSHLLRRKARPEPELLDVNTITAKALAILHQKLNFVGSINREWSGDDN